MIIIGTLLVLVAFCIGVCWPRDTNFISNRRINEHKVTPRFNAGEGDSK